jgi:DNA-binding XRE family transcriptional regulator
MTISENVWRDAVNRNTFVSLRKKLGKTQAQMAQLLGVSIKAVHSYEQGWRTIPAHVERQLFFLISRVFEEVNPEKQCWVIKKCPKDRKFNCPAWEFKAGKLCWFINGTICAGHAHKTWKEKIQICRICEVMSAGFDFVEKASE